MATEARTPPELGEVASVIATIQQSAGDVAMCSGELLSFVRTLVTKIVGGDSERPNNTPPPETAPLDPGVVGLTQAHLSVIQGNIEEITSELRRL